MKQARFFVIGIFFLSILLFLFDLPSPFTVFFTIPAVPPILKEAHPISIDLIKPYKLGLDLQGGIRLVYDLDLKNIPVAERDSAVESTRTVIEKRINVFGVSEPVIQMLKTSGQSRVIIELPGVADVNQAIALIGKTAQLSFWEESEKELSQKDATSSAYPLGTAFFMQSQTTGRVMTPIKTKLSGKDLKSATVGPTDSDGSSTVLLHFSSNGAKLFHDITRRNIGEKVMMVLDNEVLSAPVVQSEIPNGEANVTGNFTIEEAKSLVIALNAGALPVPLKQVGQTNVGPSLGIESLKKSLFAGVIGLISIVGFMVFLYKKEGALACIALIVYSIITLAIFKLLSVTLTLAGIAGFILSIGMAVDANILIFERMKEELRAGRQPRIAVEQGFRRAWTSIRDSNISSLITCVILFALGTSTVKGFALTLSIGILVSMFSAITVTRNLLRVFDSGPKKQI